ncbi:MAG: 3-oxoacyl-[acyl-carrier-protein] reductase [Proteobacteria bacterium]|nr:3-oxoacyl-[acyl-carrier-protein] reductase [Pseudomonadota bacterium]
MDLKDKVVIITGGSQGIGASIVKEFYKLGSKVYFCGRNEEKLINLSKELTEIGSGVSGYFVGDVTDYKKIEQMVDDLIKKEGRIDVLVNNAGITKDNIILRMKEEEWNMVIDTNLKGAFFFTKAVLKYMIKQKSGKIINISSVVGSMGNPGQGNYCASKAGLEGFTRAIAREVASRGITVNAVAPGYIVTPMTDILPEDVKNSLMNMIPLGRLGKPEDVAGAVLFLASSMANYITGQVLHVNGGMYM